jgi:hypothetical protein
MVRKKKQMQVVNEKHLFLFLDQEGSNHDTDTRLKSVV